MKPREFDDLIRQKFDQNDFAYDPAGWERLEEQLDGKKKKRNILVWWWVPLAGMAASVALALGVTSLLRQEVPTQLPAGVAQVQKSSHAQPHSVQSLNQVSTADTRQPEQEAGADNNSPVYAFAGKADRSHRHTNTARKHNMSRGEEDGVFGISLRNALAVNHVPQHKKIDLLNAAVSNEDQDENKKNPETAGALETFKPEEEQQAAKMPTLSISLAGGYSHGAQGTGYMAGGNIRKMISDKVYIESDVAFSTSSNVQATAYAEEVTTTNSALARHSTAKEASSENKVTSYNTTKEVIAEKDVPYDLYYAQVTPGIGYKIMKKMSVGVGPDFQRVLVDNRPAASEVDRNNQQEDPLFDVGFVGKTELAITKKVKAALYYRKGINNIITPMDKYIDRDYLQFQVRYTIFNK